MKIYLYLTPANEYSLGEIFAWTDRSVWLNHMRTTTPEAADLGEENLLRAMRHGDYDVQAFEKELNAPDVYDGTIVVLLRRESEPQVYRTPADLPRLIETDEVHTIWVWR